MSERKKIAAIIDEYEYEIREAIKYKGIKPPVKLAIVAEGRHQHLYGKGQGDKQYRNLRCLGGVPKGMFCAWNIGDTNFIQKRLKTTIEV